MSRFHLFGHGGLSHNRHVEDVSWVPHSIQIFHLMSKSSLAPMSLATVEELGNNVGMESEYVSVDNRVREFFLKYWLASMLQSFVESVDILEDESQMV
ncbi:hypothetical protein VNO80_03091 [Phaseolus coccineus]|uniref:Uncharacterized protein n=1 Tax=Phaseolus coccineus TaxID=3886 RepID=A0AAN9NVD0_PHACN